MFVLFIWDHNMKKVLFLEGKGNRKDVLSKWNAGKAFTSIDSTPKVISIKSITAYRDIYRRICIQYDNGTVEV